jgi:tRNA threonylcarbamoyladenosine biosynthesis protein TsaE
MSAPHAGDGSVSEHASHSVADTEAFGRRLGEALQTGDVVSLIGPLGAGKTRLVKGIAAGMGVADLRQVNSPTFVIVQEYAGRTGLIHVDAYRLVSAEDLLAIGFEEFGERGAVVIEWADKVAPILPADRLEIHIVPTGETVRRLILSARGPSAGRLLAALNHRR